MNMRNLLVPVVLGIAVLPAIRVGAWGTEGHELSARAAIRALPDEMPAFFRAAADRLVYLNPEPDRWRDARESRLDRALSGAHGPEHFINLEDVPAGALSGDDRWEHVDGVGDDTMPGLAPYRILELFQRLRLEFRLWREESDPDVRSWIEHRIVDDAGILGHYVTDVANPLHTTIHFDGWVGRNPSGYATGGIHQRFESAYVSAHITLADLEPRLDRPARVWTEPRRAILAHVEESHAEVERLYRLDRDHPFGADTDAPENRRLVTERLAAGALALRDAWWSAWVTSDPGF